MENDTKQQTQLITDLLRDREVANLLWNSSREPSVMAFGL